MILLLIWIGCGVGAAIIASGKGQSGCLWFGLGILLGPLALLIAAAMSPAAAPGVPVRGKACPRCAETVQAAALACRYCGHEFPAPEPDPWGGWAQHPARSTAAKVILFGAPGLIAIGAIVGKLRTDDVAAAPIYHAYSATAMAAVSASERNARLWLMVTGDGATSCRSVARSALQGKAANGDATWDVHCAGGEDFAVTVPADPAGAPRVVRCAALAAVNGRCWRHPSS